MPVTYCPNHVRSALSHSLRRAYERYSIELTEFDIFRMSDMVLQGKAKLKNKHATRIIYKLNYLGKNFVLVFDEVLSVIVTFLPHRALKNYA